MIFFGISKETLLYGLGMSQRDSLNFDQIGPALIAEQTGLDAESEIVADTVTVLEWLNDLVDKMEEGGFTARGADVVCPTAGVVNIHVEGSSGASVVANVNLWRMAAGNVRVRIEREDSWDEGNVIRTEHKVPADELDEDAMVVRDIFGQAELDALAPLTENFAEIIETLIRLDETIETAEAESADEQ